MDEASGKLSDARVHLDSFEGGAPSGCTRTQCGTILGSQNPRIVRKVEDATCAPCLANFRTWQRAQERA